MNHTPVHVWEETIILPTYKPAAPEKSPLFLETRAYQGSTGKVYPFPVTEKISDTKEDVPYRAICLENDYLYVMVLPELGGRIQRALDKTNGYDFVYYNHVIKPALVGLVGPWISGGIEFNWPQHHRPSTYEATDSYFTENADGSATIFISEIDKMYGTKSLAAFTLYPDKSYIEVKGRLFNNTDTPQTFLWWANPAVPVNEYTYSVFPPDVHAVMDHGKRAVSTFPIATGEYYKYDYSAGVDISCYRNIEVPTSYMAAHSDYDFIGNFDDRVDAGLLHVADHHISPGKKQWTWGNSDFGQAWDRNLTETDGPYIELMTGVFADNQPDFTWLKPYEEKTFTQYFMPYKHVGRVKNATKDAAVSLEFFENTCRIKAYTSGIFENVEIQVKKEDNILFHAVTNFSPQIYYDACFDYEDLSGVGCSVTLTDCSGRILVSYTEQPQIEDPLPEAAEPLFSPEDLRSTEELYLAATHLEQYRHATFSPEDYYLEGLRRDSTDIRLNNGYGLFLYRRGDFEEARSHFQTAIDKQTWKNPNPYYGECYYNLGLTYIMLQEFEKAFDAFYKSTWSYETQSAGFYWLSNLTARNGHYEQALEFIEQSLIRNWHNMKARTLKSALLRHLGKDSISFLEESLEIDPLYMGLHFEKALLTGQLEYWKTVPQQPAHTSLGLSLLYLNAGLYENALQVLTCCSEDSPMIHYYQGYVYCCMGKMDLAESKFSDGEDTDYAYCFPNRTEESLILQKAIQVLKHAPHAHYYLGCLLYDKRKYSDAIYHWTYCTQEAPFFAMAHRGLAIAYYNHEHSISKAIYAMSHAFELNSNDSRFLMEYDQLRAKAGHSVPDRLTLLEKHLDLVKERDALYVEYITLLNDIGSYDDALACLRTHQFHPWEGGEGKVSAQYRYALTQKAIVLIRETRYDEAISLLEQSKTYPTNLGEGKLPNTPDNIADYYLGIAYERKKEFSMANDYFTAAAKGSTKPEIVLYYNDQPSDTIFYIGLALEKLRNPSAASECYESLLHFGKTQMRKTVGYDYFAVSLPEIEVFPSKPQERNETYCHYLMALGHLGLGNIDLGQKEIASILRKTPDYQGAIRHIDWLRDI